MTTKYTDQQMALILQRAAERQAAGDEPTHTLQSIQEFAGQAGIDPQLVADAAATLSADATPGTLFGAPWAYRNSRRISGALRPADHAAIVATIRDHLPRAGEVRQVAEGFEWHSGPADNKLVVSITSAGDDTAVRIDARQDGPKIGLYLAAGATTMVAGLAGFAFSPVVALVTTVAAAGITFSGARALWNRIAERNQQRRERLLQALIQQLSHDSEQ